MDMKGTSDIPFYMFIEATGDSEADCNNPTTSMAEYAYEIGFADDDAQSCSYDNSEACDPAELKGYEFLIDDDEDEGKVTVYGTSYCEDDEMQEHRMKSFVSDDSGQELLDEKEKNRLFWEACLAS
ncbi:hypothetical protein SESBI_35550 [Sesbania bispinosa]|nr:hypothetical protein SESBI_35550 [Sesbania bispinosa]